MTLAELERYFAAAATSGAGPIAGLDEVFVTRGALSASERIAIYNRGYFYRLLDALAAVFGETKQALGAAEFERLGLAYLAVHPSEHHAVERVGRAFANHLRGVLPPSSVIPALAELEWARLSALVAPNPRKLASARELVPGDFPCSYLSFVPSLHCAGQTAVWRAAHAVSEVALEASEFRALSAAARGASMSEVCACFDTGASEADTQHAFQVISRWFARQWVESVDLPGA